MFHKENDTVFNVVGVRGCWRCQVCVSDCSEAGSGSGASGHPGSGGGWVTVGGEYVQVIGIKMNKKSFLGE